MSSNETSKYKLSVVEGTELQLSISTGVQGPAGPAGPQGEVGPQGVAGPNEITTSTSTNISGLIYANGSNVSGAYPVYTGALNGYFDAVPAYDDSGSLWVPQKLKFGYGNYFGSLQVSALPDGPESVTWTLPRSVSGTIAVISYNQTLGKNTISIGGSVRDVYDIRFREHPLEEGQASPFYAQLNAAVGLTNNISLTLPNVAGTLANNNTAVMLTGTQTVAGEKTFSGQMELTGQLATNGTSALTRDLGDARYPSMLKSYTTASITGLFNSTILVPITSLALPVGTYYIEVAAATYSPTGTPANTTIRFTTATSGAGEYTGSDDYGTGTLTHVDVEADPMSLTFIRQSVGTASTFFRNLRGIITINTSTTLKLEFRQSVASTNVITCRAGAYIIARKIS